jgi:cytochrome c553
MACRVASRLASRLGSRLGLRLALGLALASALAGSPAHAAPPDGLPASVPVPDTLGQRLLACTGCHGREGRSTPEGYFPRIAGKPAGYLLAQLRAFREGRRRHAVMAGLLEPLSDAYLADIAGHFAALDLPYAPPPPPVGDAAALAAGARLVREGQPARGLAACTTCHGAALTGVRPAIPGLLGLPRDYLIAQLGAWRHGQRAAVAPDCMGDVARRLEPAEVVQVAGWLAAQPLPADPHPAPALPRPLPQRCGGIAP